MVHLERDNVLSVVPQIRYDTVEQNANGPFTRVAQNPDNAHSPHHSNRSGKKRELDTDCSPGHGLAFHLHPDKLHTKSTFCWVAMEWAQVR